MRIINGKKIPTDIISKTLAATSSKGQKETLMKIDKVDKFFPTGSIDQFLRVILNNDQEGVEDSFYFSVDGDMELMDAFLQTTEANQTLMDIEMMLIQDQVSLNHFITIISREYFQKELGYLDFKII